MVWYIIFHSIQQTSRSDPFYAILTFSNFRKNIFVEKCQNRLIFDIFQTIYCFKFYLWKVVVLRSCFQIKYILFIIITHNYYAYVVPYAFAGRSSCWPLSSNQQPETDVYFVTIDHKCSKLCVVFLKIYMYMRVKFQGTVSNSFDFTR